MPLSAETRYREAAELASAGRFDEARGILIELKAGGLDGSLLSRVENDLGTLAAIRGDRREAAERFRKASELEPSWEMPRLNRSRLGEPAVELNVKSESKPDPVRVAILSFLFNWPATGGGNVHTVELAKFLAADGYEVRHIYARYDPWRIGQVREPTPHPSEEIGFVEQEWDPQTIQARFRQSVDRFDADFVIVSDSWNFKPLLAEAVRGRRVILRLQAQECLCPLNNSRLLPTEGGPPRQCGKFQLATAEACERCVETLDATSGDLHRLERGLSGFGRIGVGCESALRGDGGAVCPLGPRRDRGNGSESLPVACRPPPDAREEAKDHFRRLDPRVDQGVPCPARGVSHAQGTEERF
jgi:hypothetical protein